ncbi:MAG: hypothetical protein ACJ75R_03290 [Solirubrobacterales bacterium]
MSQGRSQLIGTLTVLLATGVALALAGAAHETHASQRPPRPVERSLARLSVAVTPRVARRVERIRDLRFEAVPRPAVVDGSRLVRITRQEQRRAGGFGGLAADQATVRMLGLLAPDERLAPASTAGSDLAAAAYDTESNRLYVVRDAVSPNEALVEFVLAHELTHAIEDGRYGLAEPHATSDDRALAEAALAEGTATAVMVDYAAGYLSPSDLLASLGGVDQGTAGVPKFVVDELEWTYLGGRDFVDALRGLAGGWKLVDYAIRWRAPASTEQVLHPDKYVHDERPLPVSIDGRALRDRGWTVATGGDVGEFATAQLLELGNDDSRAKRAAAGWGGDRYELWRRDVAPSACTGSCRGDLVLVVRWRWDTPSDATEFTAAARRYLTDGLDANPAGGDAFEFGEGAAALAASPDSTTVVLAPTPGLARASAR